MPSSLLMYVYAFPSLFILFPHNWFHEEITLISHCRFPHCLDLDTVVTFIRSSLPFISSTETEPEFSLIQVCFWGQEYFIRGIMYFLRGAQKVSMALLFLCKPLVMATDDHYLHLFFHWWLILSSFGTCSYEGNTGLELPMAIL